MAEPDSKGMYQTMGVNELTQMKLDENKNKGKIISREGQVELKIQ